jgi:hypothetical protein
MSWGARAACAAKDSEIAHLRELVASLRKENLALVDIRAANTTFPRSAASPPAESAEPVEAVHASPAQVRSALYTPPISTEQVEELFELEKQFAEGNS